MVKDSNKIRCVLSVVALSIAFGFDTRYAFNSPETAVVYEVSQVERMKVKVIGKVSGVSISRVKALLDGQLASIVKDKITENDSITIIEGADMSRYAQDQLGITSTTKRGTKLTDDTGISIYCSEDLIEQIIPQMASLLNARAMNTTP